VPRELRMIFGQSTGEIGHETVARKFLVVCRSDERRISRVGNKR